LVMVTYRALRSAASSLAGSFNTDAFVVVTSLQHASFSVFEFQTQNDVTTRQFKVQSIWIQVSNFRLLFSTRINRSFFVSNRQLSWRVWPVTVVIYSNLNSLLFSKLITFVL
jgi:hypothetical protein